jgi:hypothetical protein
MATTVSLTTYYPLIRNEAEHTFDSQEKIAALGDSHAHIYDDGKIFVLDLERKKEP